MLVCLLVSNDPKSIRRSIENYKEDKPLQMLFKAVYLLGAKECEMLGDKYGCDKGKVYGPTGDDAEIKTVLVDNNEVEAVFFKIKTARMGGKEERIVWLPIDCDCEPWAKDLYLYFKKRGAEKVFPFKRMKIRDKVLKSNVLEGLERPVTYTGCNIRIVAYSHFSGNARGTLK